MPIPRTPSKVKGLKDEYVACRARRHRWDDIPDPGGGNRRFVESRTVARLAARCERCGVIRYEAWNRITGERLFSQYDYPEDYSTAGSGAKPWNFRKEYLARREPKK